MVLAILTGFMQASSRHESFHYVNNTLGMAEFGKLPISITEAPDLPRATKL